MVKAGGAIQDPRRLVCFPALGGGASFYLPWRRMLPAAITLGAVRAPGRESRFREPAIETMDELVGAAHEGLAPLLVPPFALFGHCLGALVAFELTRRLHRAGADLPSHLFVSAQGAPQYRTAPTEGPGVARSLVEGLRRLGGTPAAVLADPGLLAIARKAIEGDASVGHSYRYRPGGPLPLPVTVFAGRDDPTLTGPALTGWQAHTTEPLDLRLLPGGHFYEPATWCRVVEMIAVILCRIPPLVRR